MENSQGVTEGIAKKKSSEILDVIFERTSAEEINEEILGEASKGFLREAHEEIPSETLE